MRSESQLFDRVLMVDWSAASKPTSARPKKDAIWWAEADAGGASEPVYCRTRAEAVAGISDRLAELLDAGDRVLVGFDFPFGYPAGVAEHICGQPDARALWRWLSERIEDSATNETNRYAVASEINRLYDGVGPMWGRPASWDFPDVPTHGSSRRGTDHPPERRIAETRQRNAKTVWQLYGAGSVGSQVLVGLPALQRLTSDPRLSERTAIWPFDTGLATPGAQCVVAEIYPSMLSNAITANRQADEVLDAAQVRVLAQAFAALDAKGGLAELFAVPDLAGEDRETVTREEAWILGLGYDAALTAVLPHHSSKNIPAGGSDTAKGATPGYLRDPAAIYAASFATIRAEADLSRFSDDLAELAIRLIHACGMTDVTDDIEASADLAASARSALQSGAPILCDAEMVAHGIIRRGLPRDNAVLCTLNDPAVPGLAKTLETTRSAAATELWANHLAGAIVAIGNAPTALFHLLEGIDKGWPKPAAILGLPVGFVGAAESKAELAANPRGIPFLTVHGRRGGSAMAAAAVNALALGLTGDGT